jgi:hypothetical protein
MALTPVLSHAQEYQMDWSSEGTSAFRGPWSIHTLSTAHLTPGGPLPPTFSGPGYNLTFEWEGRNYGGPVANQPAFQAADWRAPAGCEQTAGACAVTGFSSGKFSFLDPGTWRLEVFVGTGHQNTNLVGIGHQVGGGPVASAAEPLTLVAVGFGLAGAAILRRRNRRVS